MNISVSTAMRWAQISLPLQMLWSHRLWWPGSDRCFPMAGWGEWPLPLHSLLSTALAAVFVGAALGLLSPRRWAALSLLCFGLCSATDVNRLQPWVWMWILLAFGHLKAQSQPWSLWLLPVVYMWSGIHKLSPWSADVFTDFYDAFTLTRPLVHWGWAAYLPAALEICTGVLLLFSRTRRWGAVLATILHLYIVVLLSPLGLNWNAVVIPWNFAMTALVWAFSMTKFPPFTPLHWSGKWMIAVPLGLAALGPLLNFWGKWPETFSWKMYSNTQPEATLVYTSEGAPCPAMAAAWAKYAHHKGYLLLDDWAMDNLGTPPFNHLRLYQQVARRVRQCAEQPDSLQLQWLQVSPWNHRLPPAQNVPF